MTKVGIKSTKTWITDCYPELQQDKITNITEFNWGWSFEYENKKYEFFYQTDYLKEIK